VSDGTKIQWTEATWSPVTGCTKISDGCLNCYIERTPPFRMERRRFTLPVIGGTTGVRLHSDRLGIPVKWRKPRRIFVCSLADLFHEDVPPRFIAEVFAVMSLAQQHTYQVLTKRHARLRSVLNSPEFRPMVDAARQIRGFPPLPGDGPVVLPGVWIGVSAENQQWANIRIPALLDTPAEVRWVSAEPLIGPVTLRPEWVGATPTGRPVLDWAVLGGESGPRSRPCDPQWIRSLVEQCRAGSTAPFIKQLGAVWAQDTYIGGQPVSRTDAKGGDPAFWPEALRIREYPADRVAVAS
jgi:protein gp37